MRNHTKNAAMLWTGGKDSAMALHEAEQHGYNVQCLATFAPPNPNFLAHPLYFIKLQSQALDLPHYALSVIAPFEKSYEAGLRWLRDQMDVDCAVTGDIAAVNGYPNWIRERSRVAGINAYTPLWDQKRYDLLQYLLYEGFKAYISIVDTSRLSENWVGRKLDTCAIDELVAISADTALDLCGENGEYHTLVTDGPIFARPIAIRSYSIRRVDSLAYMNLQNSEIINHVPSNICVRAD